MMLVSITPTFSVIPGMDEFPMRKEVDFIVNRPRHHYLATPVSSRLQCGCICTWSVEAWTSLYLEGNFTIVKSNSEA